MRIEMHHAEEPEYVKNPAHQPATEITFSGLSLDTNEKKIHSTSHHHTTSQLAQKGRVETPWEKKKTNQPRTCKNPTQPTSPHSYIVN